MPEVLRRRTQGGEIRFSGDICACGHRFDEHYQPRPDGKAACWATYPLDECRDFRPKGAK